MAKIVCLMLKEKKVPIHAVVMFPWLTRVFSAHLEKIVKRSLTNRENLTSVHLIEQVPVRSVHIHGYARGICLLQGARARSG